MTVHIYSALRVKQATGHDVFVFAANPKDVLEFSQIDRVGRTEEGGLQGFQRHQIASHIKEISEYLTREDALLPNALIVAFIEGVTIHEKEGELLEVHIDTSSGPTGFVVDGQQRLTAFSGINKPDFQVIVSALVCKDYDELRQQFILINNTRPLPRTLISELLPFVDGLPDRFESRRFAARVVQKLNSYGGKSLRGDIHQHTNPSGELGETSMQKLVINSSSHGALRDFLRFEDREDRSVNLISAFFDAVEEVFPEDWAMSSSSSKLRHGVGILALGFVMDYLATSQGAKTKEEFVIGLNKIKPFTAWSSGSWVVGSRTVAWNSVQNNVTDVDFLARHLVSTLKRQTKELIN